MHCTRFSIYSSVPVHASNWKWRVEGKMEDHGIRGKEMEGKEYQRRVSGRVTGHQAGELESITVSSPSNGEKAINVDDDD